MSTSSIAIYEKEHAASGKYNDFIPARLLEHCLHTSAKITRRTNWIRGLIGSCPSLWPTLQPVLSAVWRNLDFSFQLLEFNKHIAGNTKTVKNMTDWLLKNEGAEKTVLPVNLHTAEKYTQDEFREHRDNLVKAVSKDKKIMARRNSLGSFLEYSAMCFVYWILSLFLLPSLPRHISPNRRLGNDFKGN